MSDFHEAWCVICERWHFFGFDGLGVEMQLLTCREGEPPREPKEQEHGKE
jgi:hypothetical protein